MIPSWASIAVILTQEADLLQHEVPDDHGKNPSRRDLCGTLEGDILPGDITFYRLQSTADSKLRAYIAQVKSFPLRPRDPSAVRFSLFPRWDVYRHVLIEKNFLTTVP